MPTIIRQSKANLSTLICDPNKAPADALIILLHGWGADAADLINLAPALAHRFPHAVIAAPDAPEVCSANPAGRQWFDLGGAMRDDAADRSAKMLECLVAELLAEYGLGYGRLAVLGFSQGGMMALHIGSRLVGAAAGVVSFSGALLAPHRLEGEITATPKILLIHGTEDEVVPFAAMGLAESVLKQSGFEVESVARDGLGHGIDAEGLGQAMAFLEVGLGGE